MCLTTSVICNICTIFNCSCFSGTKRFVSRFGGHEMDNYHEFRCTHNVQIKSGDYIDCPIMFPKLEVLSLIKRVLFYWYFQLIFQLQVTFTTKILLVALDKSHKTWIVNVKKIQRNTISSFDLLYRYCRSQFTMQLIWSPKQQIMCCHLAIF